jgi:hypothetical protein
MGLPPGGIWTSKRVGEVMAPARRLNATGNAVTLRPSGGSVNAIFMRSAQSGAPKDGETTDGGGFASRFLAPRWVGERLAHHGASAPSAYVQRRDADADAAVIH